MTARKLDLRSALALAAAALFMALISWAAPAPTFTPDTRYYAAMALHLGGESKDEARNTVAAHTLKLGFSTPPTATVFSWGLVGPRLVYPALSAPFVRAFGIQGMLVVPLAAFVLGVVAMARTALRRIPLVAAVAPLLLYLSSERMLRYGTSMLTEGLALLLIAVMVGLWPLGGEPLGRRAVWLTFLLMTVLAFTRQSTLIPAGAAAVAWAGSAVGGRRLRTPWLPIMACTVGAAVGWQLVQAWLWPGFSELSQWELKTHTHDLVHALRATPQLFWHIVTADVQSMRSFDLPLLLLLTLALVAAVVLFRRVEGQLLIGALLATLVYSVTNGTPTTFRYGEPGMVFLILGVGALLYRLFASAVDPAPADGVVEDGAEHDGDGLGDEQRGAQVGATEHDH